MFYCRRVYLLRVDKVKKFARFKEERHQETGDSATRRSTSSRSVRLPPFISRLELRMFIVEREIQEMATMNPVERNGTWNVDDCGPYPTM